jgi:hypothetical protein
MNGGQVCHAARQGKFTKSGLSAGFTLFCIQGLVEVGRCNAQPFVPELVDGVLISAAVLLVGLGPTAPPLCRCAEYTIDQLS